jgi:hypothetical protein
MRPMGWQVSWLAGQCNLPPSRPVACGQTSVASGKCSPLTVAGAAVGLYRSAQALDAYHIPSSLFRWKEAIKDASTTLRRDVVNGEHGCRNAKRRRLLSPPGRCITLAALSGARPSIGLASETGSRCERVIAAPSRHCPRNGKRIKANIHVTAPPGAGRHSPATGIRESGDRPGIEQRIPSRWANWAMLCRGGPVPSSSS